ncbi:MAG TPA: DUF131 domain-containing protein [Methanomassiliicoccales archaeon]|nr:DUF131 domain-containing protein [Methanomassiliicoccales archaeon]
MRALRAVGLMMLFTGLAALAIGLLDNEVSVYILLIIPVFQLNGPWSVAGALIVVLGSLVLLLSAFRSFATDERRSVGEGGDVHSRTGGVILIGPIPIIWGSAIPRRMRPLLFAIGLVLTLAMIAIFFLR